MKIENINELPSIKQLIKICKGLALVDAVLMPDWENRFFSFNSNWDEQQTEMMASMRDGFGNEYFINFSKFGCAGKVYDKEVSANSAKIINQVPEEFNSFKNEPAFSIENATFFFWRRVDDSQWYASPDNLSEYPLLGFFKNGIEFYHSWAESYYEKKIDLEVLSDVYESLDISSNQLSVINQEITLEDLNEDIQEILGL